MLISHPANLFDLGSLIAYSLVEQEEGVLIAKSLPGIPLSQIYGSLLLEIG